IPVSFAQSPAQENRETLSLPGERRFPPALAGSGRRRPVELALERGDVASSEPPLPSLLECGKDALASELVHRVAAEIEQPRDFLAVQKNIVFFDHRSISATNRARRAVTDRRHSIIKNF